MRDAGPQSRQECGARRDRELAGRSTPLIEAALRIAAAILVDTLAFVIWNLASRSPLGILRDVAAGVRRPAVLLRGLVSFAVGLLLLAGSLSLLLPLMLPHEPFLIIGTLTVLTGLLVEHLIGPELYERFLRQSDS